MLLLIFDSKHRKVLAIILVAFLSVPVLLTVLGVVVGFIGSIPRSSPMPSQPKYTATPVILPKPQDDAPKDRPDWVERAPQLVGETYQMSVMVGPFTTRGECEDVLPEALQKALGQYVETCLGEEEISNIRLPSSKLQQLVKQQFEETRTFSVGPMIQLHVLLEFDRKAKDSLLELHRQAVVQQRLWTVGIWSVAGLLALCAVWAYLKADLATRGALRGRLRFASSLAILGVVVAAVAMTR